MAAHEYTGLVGHPVGRTRDCRPAGNTTASCYPPLAGRGSGEPGEGAGAVAGFEDELGLGLPDDAVHGDVLKDEVTQGFGAFDGYVEVEVVFAGDMKGLEDAGYA